MPEKHLSSQFDSDLNNISSHVMELGGLVESQIRQAVFALSQFSPEAADDVLVTENKVNGLEVEIDREIASVIGRRQPTARDLRLLMAMSKTTANLERVGDEAAKIARMVKSIIESSAPRSLPSSDLRVSAELASGAVAQSLGCICTLGCADGGEHLARRQRNRQRV
jgi:phosphate transport system protein